MTGVLRLAPGLSPLGKSEKEKKRKKDRDREGEKVLEIVDFQAKMRYIESS